MSKIRILALWMSVALMSCAQITQITQTTQSTQSTAPVVDRSSAYGDTPAVHVAGKNENLFLVAMKYNLDYQDLARKNGIAYPYKLQTGQRVNLKSSGRSVVRAKRTPVSVVTQEKPVKLSEKTPLKQTPASSVSVPADKPVITNKQRTVAGIKWQWPLRGKVIKTYAASPENYKGIDIQANAGTSVRAVADGVVVYVGDGLEKYGNLVIISHKDIYLSAYAQLRKILADEGQTVRSGEKIAVLGSRPLHFEVRKDADTIDPQTLLP